jgi:hypothetical protein
MKGETYRELFKALYWWNCFCREHALIPCNLWLCWLLLTQNSIIIDVMKEVPLSDETAGYAVLNQMCFLSRYWLMTDDALETTDLP